jgi:hypothetical protein
MLFRCLLAVAVSGLAVGVYSRGKIMLAKGHEY